MTQRPRVGIWLFPDVPVPDFLDAAVRLEQAGLDELWVGDEGPVREPFALLAAAAARTERLRLGVAVTNPYIRHPAVAAAAAITIDELAPGRVVLGLGPGGGLALGPLHLARTRPLAAMRRALRLMRATLDGEPTEGFTPPPGAPRAPRVPIYVGARGERLNRLASAAADGVFLGGVAASMLERTIAWARSERRVEAAIYPAVAFDDAAAEHVRPAMVYGFLDAPEETRARLGLGVEDVRAAASALAAGDDRPARTLVDDRLLAELLIRGDPAAVAGQLLALAAKHDAQAVGMALTTADLGADVELIAATVGAFRELRP